MARTFENDSVWDKGSKDTAGEFRLAQAKENGQTLYDFMRNRLELPPDRSGARTNEPARRDSKADPLDQAVRRPVPERAEPVMSDRIARINDSLKRAGIPPEYERLVVVNSPSWSSQSGTLSLLVRDARSGLWKEAPSQDLLQDARSSWPVVLGRSGMRPGIGLDSPELFSVDLKREGDQAAAAGAFAVGNIVLPKSLYEHFGGSRNQKLTLMTSDLRWVDDPSSSHYNQLLRQGQGNWRSAENIAGTSLYRQGIIEIRHNRDASGKAIANGAGSAIFFHEWRGPGHPTAGCTAMAAKDMHTLTDFVLNGKAMVIQVPSEEMNRIRVRRNR